MVSSHSISAMHISVCVVYFWHGVCIFDMQSHIVAYSACASTEQLRVHGCMLAFDMLSVDVSMEIRFLAALYEIADGR